MKYFVKKAEKSPFYQKQHSQEVYLLCEQSGKVIAEVNGKLPWYVTTKSLLEEEDFQLENTSIRSKFLEVGDTVFFNMFTLGEIERIELHDQEAGYDWEDKFYLKNCRVSDPFWLKVNKGQKENHMILRKFCEHAGYKICTFQFSEEALWNMIEVEWVELNDNKPSYEEVMKFWKDRVKPIH